MVESLKGICPDCGTTITMDVTIPQEQQTPDVIEKIAEDFYDYIVRRGWKRVPDGFTFKYVCKNCAKKYK